MIASTSTATVMVILTDVLETIDTIAIQIALVTQAQVWAIAAPTAQQTASVILPAVNP